MRYIKREEDLRRTFRLTSAEMECLQNIEQGEAFIDRIIANKTNFIMLASSFKKVH